MRSTCFQSMRSSFPKAPSDVTLGSRECDGGQARWNKLVFCITGVDFRTKTPSYFISPSRNFRSKNNKNVQKTRSGSVAWRDRCRTMRIWVDAGSLGPGLRDRMSHELGCWNQVSKLTVPLSSAFKWHMVSF